MKKLLGICDVDERYSQRMQSYLMKRLTEFEVMTFDSLNQAVEYSIRQKLAVCLVSEACYDEKIDELQATHIFILQESGEKEISGYSYIEKYQSMEQLIREIMENYLEEPGGRTSYGLRKGCIHAFYSPVRRFEQTKTALALGQVLSEEGKKVIYLNMQPFSERIGQQSTSSVADITDLLYFMGRQDNGFASRLQNMKQTVGGVDCFEAAQDYMDILTIPGQQWITLLDMLLETGKYDEIILDLSEICQGLYSILEKSSYVYCLNGVTQSERNAVIQYKSLLEKRELSIVLEKIVWLELPQDLVERATNPERLGRTGLGEYMKGIVGSNSHGKI